MFFDAVIDRSTRDVVFNGMVAETCKFVLYMDPSKDEGVYVCEGSSLQTFTPREYLTHHNLQRS